MQTRKWGIGLWILSILFLVGFLSVGTKAYAADEITVGLIAPMKFSYGYNMLYGAEVAADKINAEGGIKIKGKSYKLVILKIDDNDFLSVPDAVSAMERAVTVQKLKYLIGGARSEAVLAQQEIMADHKVIYIGTGSAHDELCLRVAKNYNRYKYWFRLNPSSSSEIGLQTFTECVPAIRALQEFGIKKPRVALLIDKAQWTEPAIPVLKKLFPELGCEIIGLWQPSFNATSVTSEMSAIKSAGAHLIFNLCAGAPGNIISRTWGELQIPAVLVGVNAEATLPGHWKTTDGKCNYMLTSSSLADISITPLTRPFFAAYIKKVGEAPTYLASAGHDAVYVLKTAMERADSLDPDALVPELEKTKNVGTMGINRFYPMGSKRPHEVIWSPTGHTGVALQWRDGKQHIIWPDGRELPPNLIAAGAPSGWDKVRYKETVDYVLPPWVVEYWKDKK